MDSKVKKIWENGFNKKTGGLGGLRSAVEIRALLTIIFCDTMASCSLAVPGYSEVFFVFLIIYWLI